MSILLDEDLANFRQTAKAVLKLNKYVKDMELDSLMFLMECDAQRAFDEARDKGANGYLSTRGYVLSTFTDYAGRLRCYSSVASSLFND